MVLYFNSGSTLIQLTGQIIFNKINSKETAMNNLVGVKFLNRTGGITNL